MFANVDVVVDVVDGMFILDVLSTGSYTVTVPADKAASNEPVGSSGGFVGVSRTPPVHKAASKEPVGGGAFAPPTVDDATCVL